MKNKIIVLFIFVFVIIIVVLKTTVAYPSKLFVNTNVIEYTDNKNDLYNNIYNFIDKNDNLLIALSSYELSNVLNENYDFLERFSVNYIIDNIENYENIIVDNYISVNDIYKITENIFGKSYYYVNEKNEVKLVKDNRRFKEKINDLKIVEDEDYVNAIVRYNNPSYKYRLKLEEDRLVIENIEVL